jgi:8-oxo-dGTP pyrophosphatase MutT (NUDIX family)
VIYRRRGGGAEVALISVGEKARWQLPKGLIDPGEPEEVTARREVREETGLEGELIAPIDTVEYWYVATERGSRVRYHKRVHFFLLQCTGGDLARHDREVNEARWFPLDEARDRLAFRSERDVVSKAAALIEKSD